MPDKYDLEARHVPALVCSVPFAFLDYYYLNGLGGKFWQSAFTLTVGSLGLSAALYIVDIHFCRALGKLIEERTFRNGLDFPTTVFMLDKDQNLSAGQKARILAKIKKKFGIDLRSKTEGDDKGRHEIHEAIGQIRSIFYKKNEMVTQRNIQFGLTRNLLAGSLIATIISLAGVILSIVLSNGAAFAAALVLLGCYVLLALISLFFLKFMANQYALTLFNEFLSTP